MLRAPGGLGAAPGGGGGLTSYLWGYAQRGQHGKVPTQRPNGRVRIQTHAHPCALIPWAQDVFCSRGAGEGKAHTPHPGGSTRSTGPAC